MGQVKIYGLKEKLNPIKATLSDVIHTCLVDAFDYPMNKRFHRFFPMEKDDFYYDLSRSTAYTIIEISIFEGRSIDTKKRLIHLLFNRLEDQLQLSPHDVEITIFETPKHNWGIRGLPGDELSLDYKVDL
jgi:phenylpyruvate tautomerase PptA (4-oxalocrotonate tautomerase family)